jgi:hypothetical protein
VAAFLAALLVALGDLPDALAMVTLTFNPREAWLYSSLPECRPAWLGSLSICRRFEDVVPRLGLLLFPCGAAAQRAS